MLNEKRIFAFVILSFVLSSLVSCVGRRYPQIGKDPHSLYLKDSMVEHIESTQYDPLFLKRQLKAEQHFFGFKMGPDWDEETNSPFPETAHENSAQFDQDTVHGFFDKFPMMWPTNGKLTSYFGLRKLSRRSRTRMHAGIDISSPMRTPIFAAASGVVLIAQSKRGYGNAVVIGHDHNHETLYAHMTQFKVKPGQYVNKGETIGLVGQTGVATAPHLHFETRIAGVPYDPLLFLSSTPNKLKLGSIVPH